MRSVFSLWCLLAILVSAPASVHAAPEPARLLVHLLDYLAQDYGGAVQQGTVVSVDEYKEQLEFAKKTQKTAASALAGVPDAKARGALTAQIERLSALIQGKKPAEDVARLAHEIQGSVIRLTGLVIAPTQWPNLRRGAALFAQNCVSCHGAQGRGDGPAGGALSPKPANFMDDSRMAGISPFQAFNTIRLGVPGTGMAAFGVSDAEAWDLAFYVTAFRARAKSDATPPASAWRGDPRILAELATSSDIAWRKKHGKEEGDEAKLIALRLSSTDGNGGGPGGGDSPLDLARSSLLEAAKDYGDGRGGDARGLALVAYLSGVEPVEARLRANAPELTVELERRMMDVRARIDARKPVGEVTQAVEAALAQIEKAQQVLAGGALSPRLIFLSVLAIFLREGFEAVLVVLAILGVVRAAKLPRAERWIHLGWLAALGLGGVAWIASGWLIRLSGAQRELMEGVTSLFAVAILLYMGFWLHSRAQIGKWKEFIHSLTQGRLDAALSARGCAGLAAVSFIAVFREAFEVVLFLRALVLEGGDASSTALGLGVAVSFVLVLAMAWALLRYSARLPIRRLFQVSSFVMSALAVILTGKGLHSLQESGLLSITAWKFGAWIEQGARSVSQFVGFYPTLETGVPQLVVLAGIVALSWIGKAKVSGSRAS